MCLVGTPNYCDPTTLPIVNNANSPSPITLVGWSTYYTCALGFQSTGGVTNPYVTCNAKTATAGQWSTPVYTCQGTCEYSYVSLYSNPVADLRITFITVPINIICIGSYSYCTLCNAVFSGYCPGAAPSVPNANSPVPVTTVFSSTLFTCNSGAH